MCLNTNPVVDSPVFGGNLQRFVSGRVCTTWYFLLHDVPHPGFLGGGKRTWSKLKMNSLYVIYFTVLPLGRTKSIIIWMEIPPIIIGNEIECTCNQISMNQYHFNLIFTLINLSLSDKAIAQVSIWLWNTDHVRDLILIFEQYYVLNRVVIV